MADVIRIELSGEERRLIDNLLYKHLANITDRRLLPLDGCKEEYDKADILARKLIRAEFAPQTARTEEQRTTDQAPTQKFEDIHQPAPRPQQQEQRSSLPPLSSYQPQSANNAQPASSPTRSGGRRISDKQAARFYGIGKTSTKRPSEVTEKLKSLGFSNYKAITIDKYDELINWLQA